jgi:cytochrome c peroxidase
VTSDGFRDRSPVTGHWSRVSVIGGAALWLALGGGADAQAPLEVLLDFSKDERRVILQHGPWPPPPARDPSNRVSGNPEAIALGEKLFFDPRVSGKNMSCATCHVPEKGWADGRKVGMGMVEVDRNTPSVHNVGFQRWFGWDGANDNLWAQSVRPMLDAREMGSTERNVADLVRNDADLACRYRKAFSAAPATDNDEGVVVNAGKALAAFQETLVTGRTPFDAFRDALARGDLKAAARYPQDAQKGLRIFAGKGNCSLCHFGPNFTHGEFHEIGIPVFKKVGGVDWGRYEGIKMVRATRFNLLGAYNDDPKGAPGTATRHVALIPQAFEQFKVPTLRNVALTAPYMHNGHLATLADVVRHYSTIDPTLLHVAHVYFDPLVPDAIPTDTLLKPLKLSSLEISYLVSFLETLTDAESRAPRKPVPACQ